VSKFIATLILSVAVCAAANAGQKDHGKDGKDDRGWGQQESHRGGWDGKPVKAPEIDPASAASGLTLLLSGLAVIRGRREKK
jgi:hypothetical protein